ncbi:MULTISPECIES: hypothetical protein [Bacillus]|uniref:Uncharacterized protein n=1 Tax=Bacillus infantis NRRL B-14911 TaxID=1367477 RepID=U5L603_9BACI|nr:MULTISPECIES: hypothetical protein [Bacillus]AGX02835.1 hypothetical protein N288_04390 [Bacillus infantis NRRL B-14911]MCP1157093.1 hypothetical protein [Bacillus infantis]
MTDEPRGQVPWLFLKWARGPVPLAQRREKRIIRRIFDRDQRNRKYGVIG